jgi:uncharacterized protein YdhG (YjbR/CyaY superfamily)
MAGDEEGAMSTQTGSGGFSAEEKAAMKERAAEVRAAKKAAGKGGDPDAELRAKIAELPEPDRTLALRVHEIVREVAPDLEPRTWYGMPAWAKAGKVLLFVQPASKFKARYATLGFNDGAALDDGTMWPTSFAVTTLTKDDEARVAALIRKAAGSSQRPGSP